MKCYKCGKEYENSNKFCPYCGNKKGISVCNDCAHIVAEDHKFCGNCGANNIRWMQEDKIDLLKESLQGDTRAQANLGHCYHEGQGVEQSYDEAVKWYRKAAEQGEALAQDLLGDCYYEGHGVEQSYDEAVKWYRKAAEQGDATAQADLGVCYYKGHGVEQSYDEAVKWLRKAAEQGNDSAQNNLKDLETHISTVPEYSFDEFDEVLSNFEDYKTIYPTERYLFLIQKLQDFLIISTPHLPIQKIGHA